jgi:hypothetical protein
VQGLRSELQRLAHLEVVYVVQAGWVLVNSILTMTVNTCPTGNSPSLRSCVRSSKGPPRNKVAVDATNCSIDVINVCWYSTVISLFELTNRSSLTRVVVCL